MSKIYEEYKRLKEKDKTKLYLFKSGKFYIFIEDDARIINEYVVLKIVPFGKETIKCGFPENVLDNYIHIFKNHHINVEVIDRIENHDSLNIIKFIEDIDINHITPVEALNKLNELKEALR